MRLFRLLPTAIAMFTGMLSHAQVDSAQRIDTSRVSPGFSPLIEKFTAHSTKTDSALILIQQLPARFLIQVDKKINTYSNRITSKTEKTLIKLSKWENKIHSLLQKVTYLM